MTTYLQKKLLLTPDDSAGGSVTTAPAATTPAPSPAASMAKAATALGGGKKQEVKEVPASVKASTFGVEAEMDGLLGTNDLVGDAPSKLKTKVTNPDDEHFDPNLDIGDGSPKPLSDEEKEQLANIDKKGDKPKEQAEEDNTQVKDEENKIRTKSKNLESFDPEDRPFVKQMSDKAGAHFLRKLNSLKEEISTARLQLKEIEDGGLPLSYQNHPDAFILSPEYKQAAQGVQRLSQEAEHWREQLQRVINNEAFNDIAGFDKDGNLARGELIQPNPQLIEDVRALYYKANNLVENEKGKLGQLRGQFKAGYDKNKTDIDNGIKQHLGWLDSPSLAGVKIKLDGVNEEFTTKELGEFFKNSYAPKAFKDHPMTAASASLFAAFTLVNNLYQQEKAKNNVKAKNTTDAAKAEPLIDNGGVAPTPKTVNLGKRGSVRDFNFQLPNNLGI